MAHRGWLRFGLVRNHRDETLVVHPVLTVQAVWEVLLATPRWIVG